MAGSEPGHDECFYVIELVVRSEISALSPDYFGDSALNSCGRRRNSLVCSTTAWCAATPSLREGDVMFLNLPHGVREYLRDAESGAAGEGVPTPAMIR